MNEIETPRPANPLDQVYDYSNTELDMYREQQQMITKMGKLQAEAFLTSQTETKEEVHREEQQMHWLRLEQLQLIQLQQANEEEEPVKSRAVDRLISAPARRVAWESCTRRVSSPERQSAAARPMSSWSPSVPLRGSSNP